jgi:hypothetical protein
MPASTKTGAELLTGFSDFIGDEFNSTTTTAGAADGSSLTDTELQELGTNALEDWYIRFTSGAVDGDVVRIESNSGSTASFHAPASAQVASGVTYELHKYDPARKFDLLDRARKVGFPAVSRLVFDETITGDGWTREIPLPASILRGPVFVKREVPLSTDHRWNFLTSPKGDSLTGWAVAGGAAAASLYAEDDADLLVPKYDEQCTRITVPDTQVVTYTQVVANMANGVTAAAAAGRRVTAGIWVYARVASRVTLGLGWELLEASGTVDGDNATTLSVQLSISSGAVMNVFWNRAWFLYGEQLPDFYHVEFGRFDVRRDGTTQELMLPERPPRKRQLRLIGRGLLTALGTSTPATGTMELDDLSEELLYAFAARELYRELGNAAEMSARTQRRIALAEQRLEEAEGEADYDLPASPRIQGPYS